MQLLKVWGSKLQTAVGHTELSLDRGSRATKNIEYLPDQTDFNHYLSDCCDYCPTTKNARPDIPLAEPFSRPDLILEKHNLWAGGTKKKCGPKWNRFQLWQPASKLRTRVNKRMLIFFQSVMMNICDWIVIHDAIIAHVRFFWQHYHKNFTVI